MHAEATDFILDAVQNSVEAGASLVTLDIAEGPEGFEVFIADNGCGMSPELRARALDPFFSDGSKHRRRVGLGLPFLKQAAEACDGIFDLRSEPGEGTSLHFRFPAGHVDSPPGGDVAAALLSVLALGSRGDVAVTRSRNGRAYRAVRSEIESATGPLDTSDALILLRDYLRSQEEGLQQGEDTGHGKVNVG